MKLNNFFSYNSTFKLAGPLSEVSYMKKIFIFKCISIFVLCSSCSQKAFESQSNINNTSNNSQTSNTPPQDSSGSDTNNPPQQPSTPSYSINDLDLKGRLEDSTGFLGFNGNLTFDFDKNKGQFIIMIPQPGGMYLNSSGSVPNHSDITYGPVFDATTGRLKTAVRVPIKYVIKGSAVANPSKLPNGENLPEMPAGMNELPSFAITFPANSKIKMNIYIGVNALAVYLSLPPEATIPLLPMNISIPVKNKDKSQTFGYLTYVIAKNGSPPGLFISSIIPASAARVLEDYFHL